VSGIARSSILAEIERSRRLFAQWVIHELMMAVRAKVEPKALAQGLGKLVRGERFVTLEELSDRFHRIIFKIIFLDFRRVKTGISLNFDHVSAISGGGQILAAEITREVDHQRFVPQIW
jgi:hypothetical protein